MPGKPYAREEAVQLELESVAFTDPLFKNKKAADFMDNSIVSELDGKGFLLNSSDQRETRTVLNMTFRPTVMLRCVVFEISNTDGLDVEVQARSSISCNLPWRRREGVEPSGDLTIPRLVLKTSGTTGHLPSPTMISTT
jgi:hypothetical protein